MKKRQAALTGLAALTLFDIVGAQVPAHAQTPVFNWTGYYVGVHTGYRVGQFSGNVPSGTPEFDGCCDFVALQLTSVPFSANAGSGIFGFQAGYNYQVSPDWLVGIETAWSWGRGTARFSTLSETSDGFITSNSLNYKMQMTWSGDVRGRLGIVKNDWLFYGTGGVAFQQVKVSGNTEYSDEFSISVLGNIAQSKVLSGYVIGAGVERMTVDRWTWRLEYLFADFGRQSFDMPFVGTDSVVTFTGSRPLNIDLQTHTIRVGVTKLFNP